MCKSPLHNFLLDLPKCEHHIHLEGCLTPRMVFELAKKNHIDLPDPSDNPAYSSVEALENRYLHFENLEDFLECHYRAMAVLVTEEDFEALAWEYFSNAYNDGVRHAEVFFDPQSHTSRGVPFQAIVNGYDLARKRAWKELRVSSRLIMCFLRHLPQESAEDTMSQAIAAGAFTPKNIKEGGNISDGSVEGPTPVVVGVGLDSSEVGFPPEDFTRVFSRAISLGIHRTAHAGEEGPPSYIAGALDQLSSQRIDHGIRVVEDAALLDRVAREKILLTVCPLSNVYLKVVQNVAELPLRLFLDKGVMFSLSSDDPAYFGGYVLNNYCAVQEAFNFTIDEWRVIAENSIQKSWIGTKRMSELMLQLETSIEKYENTSL